MKHTLSFLAVLLLVTCFAFGAEEGDIAFPISASIPPEVITAFGKYPASSKYVFSAHINPFYIQGDFNGDGKLDTAILIKQRTSGKIGIAIIHGGSTTVYLIGAGQNFGNGGDNFSWMDSWYAYPKGVVYQGAEDFAPPKLKGDAIMVIHSDSSNALVYWTGKQYEWYQQGD